MRKIITVICIAMIILGICGNLAANAEITDLLEGYGSFENGKTGWSGSWDSNSSVNTDTVHSGNKALKITNSTIGAPWVMCTYSGLIEGATYTLEGYINGYFTGSKGAGFKTEAYGDNAFEGKEAICVDSTNGQWVKLTHTFTAPKGASNLKVYCRLYTTGTVYFDDVVLYLAALPPAFSFSTKDVFHYTDDTSGSAEVTLNSYYDVSAFSSKAARFSITEDSGGGTVASQIIPFTQRTLTYNYNPQLLSKGKKYTLTATLYDTLTSQTVDEYTQSLYTYDRPATLAADGFVRYDGEIFNPVIAYHVTDKNDYKYMKSIGVNVVQIPYWFTSPGDKVAREALLAELDRNGLKGLFCLYRNMKMPNDPANYSNTLYVVNELKDDPRIFAWAIMDEPLGAGVTDKALSDLETSYKMVKDIDSMHPIYFVDYTSTNFSYDLKYCDMFAVDPYNYSLTGVVGMTQNAVSLAQGKKPIYTIVGTFMTGNGDFPTSDLVRHMTYQSLLYGAKGFGFYSFEDSIPASASETGEKIPLYDTDLWDGMCRYAENDMPWAFKTLVRNTSLLTISDEIAEKHWTENGETYYFIMSMSTTQKSRTYKTRGADLQVLYGTDLSNVALNKDVASADKTINVSVPGGAIMLFKVEEPDEFNLIANGDFEGIDGSLTYQDAKLGTLINGWTEAPANNLVTDSVTGNHYFQNNTGEATCLCFKPANLTALPDSAKVYKLSYDYKHPDGTKMQLRFNAGNSECDWSIRNEKSPGNDVWHNYSVFLYNYSQTSNETRIGGNSGSFLPGIWCIDNVKLEEARNEVVFSNNSDTYGDWAKKANAGRVGDNGTNTLSYKAERMDPINSLAGATVDPETGERTLDAVVHYLPTERGVGVKAFAAVYREKDGLRKLHSVTMSEGITLAVPMTTIDIPEIKIPAAEAGVRYSVKVMVWNSYRRIIPVLAGSEISE